jgi:hypothetical protein
VGNANNIKAITYPTIVTASDVYNAIVATLKPRLAYYAEQRSMEVPRGYTYVSRFEKFPEDQVPLVITIIPGITELPERTGNGAYSAVWAASVTVMCSARTEDETRAMTHEYGGLVRATILQQPSLGGFASHIDWMGESYDELPITERRSAHAVENIFGVRVNDVVNAMELPFMPGDIYPTEVVDVQTEVKPFIRR